MAKKQSKLTFAQACRRMETHLRDAAADLKTLASGREQKVTESRLHLVSEEIHAAADLAYQLLDAFQTARRLAAEASATESPEKWTKTG
jgi:dTDP-4-dehydrorhamnose reductase